MASKKFEKGSSEWLMFQDYWKLCQQFWNVEDNDEYWEGVIEETNEFWKKYKDTNDLFARKIVLAFVDTLEEKYKEKKKN